MRRNKQQISEEQCKDVLIHAPRGVLSLIGDDGYPYGVPITHWYCEENGHIYFHGAGVGHKVDAMKTCDKASYCVIDEGYRKEGDWALYFNSVIVFGRMRIVEDRATKVRICTDMCKKFTNNPTYISEEMANFDRVTCYELIPEHMTGKHVHEK